MKAVVLGVQAFREHDCAPGEVSQIDVEVRKSVTHTLRLRRVNEWLHGASTKAQKRPSRRKSLERFCDRSY